MSTYGDRLRKLRKSKNIDSQREFGKLFELSESTISMYERNERRPDYETLEKFAKFFDVSIDYIITGREIKDSSNEMWKELLDPNTQVFFKDLMDAPEEKIQELITFWEFIKERDKNK